VVTLLFLEFSFLILTVMKKILLSLSLLFIFISQNTFAQYYYENHQDQDRRELYERKIVTYTKMKKTGWTVAAVGTGATIIGIIMISNAEWETTTNSYGQTQTTTSDPEGVVGILGVSLGIPAAVAGAVFGIIGAKKQNQYMGKLERLDIGYRKYNDYNSIRLTYRF
jgi:hypothetical protein